MIAFRGVDDIEEASREYGRIVGYDMPKAEAWIEVRGWRDPAPLYCISFRSGQVFRSRDWRDTFAKARAQYLAIEKLTGEPP